MFQAIWECDRCGHIWGAPPKERFDSCPSCGSDEIEQSDQPVVIN